VTILEFFNVYNVDHLKAYKYLSEHGRWPEGFIPENTRFQMFWQILLMAKMTNAWIAYNIQEFGSLPPVVHYEKDHD
jgi:hypothetical protein